MLVVRAGAVVCCCFKRRICVTTSHAFRPSQALKPARRACKDTSFFQQSFFLESVTMVHEIRGWAEEWCLWNLKLSTTTSARVIGRTGLGVELLATAFGVRHCSRASCRRGMELLFTIPSTIPFFVLSLWRLAATSFLDIGA